MSKLWPLSPDLSPEKGEKIPSARMQDLQEAVLIVPVGIRQVSWYLGILAGSIVSLVVSALGYRVQMCLQFSKHLLELGRSKPRKTMERPGEPQAVQFKGAAEHLPDHEVHITAYGANSLCVGGPLDLQTKTDNDQRSLEAEIRQTHIRIEVCFVTKTFSKKSLLTFIFQARSRAAHHSITP